MIEEMIAPGVKIMPMLDALQDYYASVGILDEAYWSGGYELGIAFPPDWVGSKFFDNICTTADDVFEPMSVVNHECNFFGPRGTGQSATIDTIIFEEDVTALPSQLTRELQIIPA